MPTLLHHPDFPLTPAQLDEYLTAGWRPTGQSIYTADYLRTDEDAIYGCLQLRVPLQGFTFKKRHRKLLRKNGALFSIVVQKASIPDEEMQAVNRRYLEVNPDKSQENLAFHIIGDRMLPVLNTWETRVYLKKKLIAFSYFDVGQQCLYSKAGIYDPAFGDYSLGTYTMLLELEWALAKGFRYYHPGYYSPSYPVFNYKLNFGPTEYRDPASSNWSLLKGEPSGHPADPYFQVGQKLNELITAFAHAGVTARLLEYPSFTARYYYANSDMNPNDLLDGALLVEPYGPSIPEEHVITYNLMEKAYICYETSWAGMQDFKLLPVSPVNGRARYNCPVAVHSVVVTAPTATEILDRIRLVRKP